MPKNLSHFWIGEINKFIFLEKIEKNGITIIPVLSITYGYGSGSGIKAGKKGKGRGFGIISRPIGYIEIKNQKSRFVRIDNLFTHPSLVAVTGFFAYLFLKGLIKLLR